MEDTWLLKIFTGLEKDTKKVGILKNSLKDAILDGKIKNDKESAIEFMKMKATEINLKSND